MNTECHPADHSIESETFTVSLGDNVPRKKKQQLRAVKGGLKMTDGASQNTNGVFSERTGVLIYRIQTLVCLKPHILRPSSALGACRAFLKRRIMQGNTLSRIR